MQAFPNLGLIEGFYGKPWTWAARADTVSALAENGFHFHIYAPKAATWLRRDWRANPGTDERNHVIAHGKHCRSHHVAFGVGLSPNDFDYSGHSSDWLSLDAKIASLAGLGISSIALLFDDVRGDDAELADKQASLVQRVIASAQFETVWVCPSYYSDDAILDQVFGQRPARYLENLAAALPAEIGIFWTGPEVCSRELAPAHLRSVGQRLGRKPLLWDNYPVNDGPRMSQVLHLRAFTGRHPHNAELIAGHAINPALQPVLTRIPAMTLERRYRQTDDVWCAASAFAEACEAVLGAELGAQVRRDLIALQDTGRDRLGDKRATLRDRYAAFDHPGAREIVSWLDGAYEITDEIVRTQ